MGFGADDFWKIHAANDAFTNVALTHRLSFARSQLV